VAEKLVTIDGCALEMFWPDGEDDDASTTHAVGELGCGESAQEGARGHRGDDGTLRSMCITRSMWVLARGGT
jgi:hypothetical protein